MALIIEDGTIVASAQSYAAASDLVTWAALRNLTIPAATADQEALLMLAMDALTGKNWKGSRVSTDQVLDFPRAGIIYDGQLLPSDEIPSQLFYAQLSLAYTANSVVLQPSAAAGSKGPVIKEKVDVLEVAYANPSKVYAVAADSRADALLNGLLRHAGLQVIRV